MAHNLKSTERHVHSLNSAAEMALSDCHICSKEYSVTWAIDILQFDIRQRGYYTTEPFNFEVDMRH